MDSKHSNVEPSGNNAANPRKKKEGLTPRQLIHYHMNNPNEPILDEDIESLVLTTYSNVAGGYVPVDTISGVTDKRMLIDKNLR